MNSPRGRKLNGYWNEETVKREAKSLVNKHGPDSLTANWLESNGYGAIYGAMKRYGGLTWIRQELQILEGRKPTGYWKEENIIREAGLIIKDHGETALCAKWLKENGFSALAGAIKKAGGFSWIRSELGIMEERAPKGYWTAQNTILAAKKILRENGEDAIKSTWLKDNGHKSLAKYVMIHGGYKWLRKELNISEKKRSHYHWTKENVISDCKKIREQYGEESLTTEWLRGNGHSYLYSAMVRHGGLRWARQELGIAEKTKPDGYWSDESVLAEARYIAKTHGEDKIKTSWLRENGYSSLCTYISRQGGMKWLKEKIGIPKNSRRDDGYWTRENTLMESSRIVDEYGPDRLEAGWLTKNGHGGLVKAISKYGGFVKVRQELGAPKIRTVRGYWSKEENVLEEARNVIRDHGSQALTNSWLGKNGYSSLRGAIIRSGGFAKIYEILGITSQSKRREDGYWSKQRTIQLGKGILGEYGESSISDSWFRRNGYSSISSSITRHWGSIRSFRSELGIEAESPNRHATAAMVRRRHNLDRLKSILQSLCLEGVNGFTSAQLVVVLQQAKLNIAPIDEGRDIYLSITQGLLLPEELLEWCYGEMPEPAPKIANPELQGDPIAMGKEITPDQTNDDQKDYDLQIREVDTTAQNASATHVDVVNPGASTNLQPLALMDPADQLRFLDAEIFASADDEAIEALISMGLHQLWAKAYLGHNDTDQVIQSCKEFHPKRPWSKRLQDQFLGDYEKAVALQLPEEFNYRVGGQLVDPRLMQRHVATLAIERRRLLVMSDMGTGKSLAAQLAVMADGAQRVLVIAINSCTAQWVYDFTERWLGNAIQLLDMESIRALTDRDCPAVATSGRTVWVIPAHLLSLMKDQDVAAVVDGLEPDAVILDEIHIFKQREGVDESQRRQQTLKLLTAASDIKPEMMVLGLSGTVITNSLNEGRTLLELVMGEERPDLPTGRGIAKAMRMHQALMANGIRQRASNDFPYVVERPEVDATEWLEEVQQALGYPPRLRPLQVEKALIHARIPAILNAIKGPTVVVTQYVEGFIEPLRKAIKAAGLRVGVHTGEEKLPIHGHENAVEAFKAGALDVLLASINTVSTGVDGLQNVSSNLVIASMPWTAADYLQVIARLARSGQDTPVRVVIPTTHISYDDDELGPAQWSFCGYRASIIACKQRLMDAVMDGLVPESEEITEAKAGQQLVRWLERLNTQGALVRPSRPIRVPLVFDSEEEETKVRARFGDWSSCNGRWNSQASSKLHKRLQSNPEEWELYHTDLESMRKKWDVDPLQEAMNHCLKSQGLVIGDFGCGTATLAEELRDRHVVHSFDHVAINDKVTACDIADRVPLPDRSLDLAIFSLSLMGPNWKDQLVEARRCLKPTGQVLIWTAASGKDAAEFSGIVEGAGFKVVTSQSHYKWLNVWAVCI